MQAFKSVFSSIRSAPAALPLRSVQVRVSSLPVYKLCGAFNRPHMYALINQRSLHSFTFLSDKKKEQSIDDQASPQTDGSASKISTQETTDTRDETANKQPEQGARKMPKIDSSFSASNLASKILSEQTGIPNEPQPEIPDRQEQKDFEKMTPAERRKARRNRSALPRKDAGPSTSTRIASYGLTAGLIIGAIGYFGQPYDSEETEKGMVDEESDSAFIQITKRIYNRSINSTKFFSEPASTKLLPDPDVNQPAYTLVISLDDLLVKTTWDKDYGWRIAKRPHLDAFLAYMSSMYELVIFSDQPSYSAEPILVKLDPYGYAPYRLYKEQTRHVDGKNVKDLSLLNRDLSKVILLDTDPNSYSLQQENSIRVPAFSGDANDTWLLKAAPLFEYIYMMETDDVRKVLEKYKGDDICENYNKWEQDIIEKLKNEWENKQNASTNGNSIQSYLNYFLGFHVEIQKEAPLPQFVQIRQSMRKNFEVQHAKMIKIIMAEQKKAEEENKKVMSESTIWDMAQTMVNEPPQNGSPYAK